MRDAKLVVGKIGLVVVVESVVEVFKKKIVEVTVDVFIVVKETEEIVDNG